MITDFFKTSNPHLSINGNRQFLAGDIRTAFVAINRCCFNGGNHRLHPLSGDLNFFVSMRRRGGQFFSWANCRPKCIVDQAIFGNICGWSNVRSAELVGVAQPIACCGQVGQIGRGSSAHHRMWATAFLTLAGRTQGIRRLSYCERHSVPHAAGGVLAFQLQQDARAVRRCDLAERQQGGAADAMQYVRPQLSRDSCCPC